MAKKVARKKKKEKGIPSSGIAHIHSTFNNTIVTITDMQGNTLAWSSAGVVGFKGTRKGTPYAAAQTGADVGKRIYDMGMKELSILVKGPGPGREAAIRALQSAGLDIKSIKDVTPMPHNGCRPRKRRRV